MHFVRYFIYCNFVFVWGYTQVKQQFISQMSPHKKYKIQVI